jgi:hypothetical protein
MFHIDINDVYGGGETVTHHDIEIRFESDIFNFSFIPESCNLVEDTDVEADNGRIDGDPSNGEFYLTWSPEEIVFCCAKYGGWCGGQMQFKIKNTEKTMKSLRLCLLEWKNLETESDC